MRTDTCRRVGLGATALGIAVLGIGPVALSAPARADDNKPTLATTSAAALKSATADADRQAMLVAGEDQRLIQAELAVQPDPQHPSARIGPHRLNSGGNYTLVLTKRAKPYTFDELRKLARDTLIPQPDGSFLLREHILVGPGATLTIAPRQPLVIKMSSGPGGFVSLVTQGGTIRLNGTATAPITFESWDETHGKQDRKVSDGRAYVRASGQLVVRHTKFSRLGFWSGRTGGLSVVSSSSTLTQDVGAVIAPDVTSKAVNDHTSKQTEVLPAGKLPAAAQDPSRSFASQISDSTITGNAYGLFVTGSSGPRIEHTVITKSLVDGLVLHRNVDSASVSDVEVDQSGRDGVVISREVEGSLLTRLLVKQNGRDGIVMAGRPLASGPSASGSSIRAFGNNTLTASQSSGNLRIGIHVIGGTAIRVQGNTVNGGRSGIVVSNGAADIDVDSNRVAGAAANGIQVRESRQVSVTANAVRDSPTGIHVRNSISAVRQNSTSGVTLHGITFVGAVSGSVVSANQLSGSGTSAIDLVRVSHHDNPVLKENDLSGWKRTVTSDSLLSVLLHPLTVIWICVALILIVMSRPRRRVTQLPYRIDPLRDSLNRSTVTVTSTASPSVSSSTTPSGAGRRSNREPEPAVFALAGQRTPHPVLVAPPARSLQPQLLAPPAPAARPAPSPLPPVVPPPAGPEWLQPEPSVPTPQPVAARSRPDQSHRPDQSYRPDQSFRPAQASVPPTAEPATFTPAPVFTPAPPLPEARPLTPAQLPSRDRSRPQLRPRPERPEPPERSERQERLERPERRPTGPFDFEPRAEAQPEPDPQTDAEPAMAGHGMIDLAIREAQLSPAVPRRRRSVGR